MRAAVVILAAMWVSVLTFSGARGAEPAVAMRVGTAKGVITPEKWKSLITVMGVKPIRKDHDIFARVLVLNDGASRLAIVTYDLNCLDVATPILRKRCRDELNLPPSHLILMGTHNHSAPIQIVPGNFEYGRWLADRIFGLIQEAIGKEEGPARVYSGRGEGDFLVTVGNAPADYDIHLLKVTVGGKEGGERTAAVLFNHPTHPMQSALMQIDTGHPGYAVDFLEEKIPGALVLYADACGGNQFPNRGRVMYGPHAQVLELGKELGEAALKTANGPLTEVTGKLGSTLEVLSLPLAAPLSLEEAKKLAEEKKVPLDLGFVPYPHPDRGTNWIRSLIQHHEQQIPFPKTTTDRECTDDGFLVRETGDGREYPCKYEEVIVSTIGPLCFVAMQGEVCAPIGMRIKDGFRRKMPLFIGAYMGEHNLYIPTRELVRQDAYQAQVIRTQYASPVGWAPEVEDEMVNGVMRVMTKMTGVEPERVMR